MWEDSRNRISIMNLISSLQFYQKMYAKYFYCYDAFVTKELGTKTICVPEITSCLEWYLCVLSLFYLKQKHIKASSFETIDQNESKLDFDDL